MRPAPMDYLLPTATFINPISDHELLAAQNRGSGSFAAKPRSSEYMQALGAETWAGSRKRPEDEMQVPPAQQVTDFCPCFPQ